MKCYNVIKVSELDIYVLIFLNFKKIMLSGKILLKDIYNIIVFM